MSAIALFDDAAVSLHRWEVPGVKSAPGVLVWLQLIHFLSCPAALIEARAILIPLVVVILLVRRLLIPDKLHSKLQSKIPALQYCSARQQLL